MALFGFLKKKKDEGDQIYQRLLENQRIENLYKPIMNKHFSLIETYESLYSSALKAGLNSPSMNNVVRLCEEDIALSPKIKEYCEALNVPLFTLPAYKRLAILYTKQKQYDKAIEICDASIRIGNLPDDFRARKAKLEEMKKKVAHTG